MSASGELKEVVASIASQESFQIKEMSSLAGGDINLVFLLKTSEGNQVLKLNAAARYPGMFEAEKQGLQALKASRSYSVPEVLGLGETLGESYLLLQYLPPGKPGASFWKDFAVDLVKLHQCTAESFGFPVSNYIGNLPQYNATASSAAEFYISQRLEPQFRMAVERGFSLGNTDKASKNIATEIPAEPASLVHGDLWNGNYLVSEEGRPCLIDPAVAYAPREMDLAMMRLFGGFPQEVFHTYNDLFPLPPDHQGRLDLWQLYYLLVHLNIFGSGYLGQVKRILERYS